MSFHCSVGLVASEWCGIWHIWRILWSWLPSSLPLLWKKSHGQMLCHVGFHGVDEVLLKPLDSATGWGSVGRKGKTTPRIKCPFLWEWIAGPSRVKELPSFPLLVMILALWSIHTIFSGLWRRITQNFLSDAGAPLTSAFSQLGWTYVCLWSPSMQH
jgi:hypothetical protein